MKRRFWNVIAMLAIVISFVACGKKNNDELNQAAAINAANQQNLLRSNCLNNPYVPNNQFTTPNCGFTNFANNGIFSPYPRNNGYYMGYNHGFADGFNRCPHGSIPTYHPSMGLSCLPTHHLSGMGWGPGMGQNFPLWQWNPYSFRFSGHIRFQFPSFGGGYGQYGYNGVMSSCIRGKHPCSIGSCAPIGGGRIGICRYNGRGGHGHRGRMSHRRPPQRRDGHRNRGGRRR